MSSLMPIACKSRCEDRFRIACARDRVLGCRRVLELQALPAPATHPIAAFHPAVVREQLIGRRRIKLRTGRIRYHSPDGRTSHGRCTADVAKPMASLQDQGLVINRHRHRLAHFRMVGQHRVVEVEVQPLEGGTGGSGDERIVAEALVVLHLAHIQEPGRRDGPRLQILENGVLLRCRRCGRRSCPGRAALRWQGSSGGCAPACSDPLARSPPS